MDVEESDESDVELDMEGVIADPDPVDASHAMVRLDRSAPLLLLLDVLLLIVNNLGRLEQEGNVR